MSTLVVVAYPDEYRAVEVLETLRRMNKDDLIDLEDACYVTKDGQGKLKLHQNTSLAGVGAAWGGIWGLIIGLLFFVPFLGAAIGAGLGILSAKLGNYWTDDAFAGEVTSTMRPNSSAIFMMTRRVSADRVVPELAMFGGTILQTSLSPEIEERLQEALDRGAGQQVAQAAAEAQATSDAETDTEAAGPIVTMTTPIPGVTGNP